MDSDSIEAPAVVPPPEVEAKPGEAELPKMDDLRALATDLDDIDATLARLDETEEPDQESAASGPAPAPHEG